MTILFLLAGTRLKGHGHTVLNPTLPDDDFDEAVRIAQGEFDGIIGKFPSG
jgi:hypothetical protein